MALRLHQYVTDSTREYRWKVFARHRDGTVSVMAAWRLRSDGRDLPISQGGYVGDQYLVRRIDAAELVDASYPGAAP